MLAYTLRRVLSAIPVMVTVAVFVFLLLRLTPGDPAAIIAGDMATPEQLEKIRVSLGLDKPLLVQFFSWIMLLLQGNLGTSLISNTPVTGMIAKHIEPTVSIALMTITLSNNPMLNGRGTKGFFGWPEDAKLEELRASYVKATTPEEQKKVAGDIQAHAMETVNYVPLGQYKLPSVWRNELSGFLEAPVPVFWNIEKKE